MCAVRFIRPGRKLVGYLSCRGIKWVGRVDMSANLPEMDLGVIDDDHLWTIYSNHRYAVTRQIHGLPR